MEIENSNIPTEEPDSRQFVPLEILIPLMLHQQMTKICEMRRTSLNEILLDLIDRFMPPDSRPEIDDDTPPPRIRGRRDMRGKSP